MKKIPFSLILILLLAFALRLFALGTQSLWYDEGVSWYLTRFSLPALVGWTAADIQPPLYYLILWFSSRLFGQSEWALRFPSVIFGLLTLPVMFQLACRLFENRPAHKLNAPLLAMIFAALAPLMVYYSQEARMYTLLVFEASLGSYLLWRICAGKTGWKYLSAYIITMAAGLYTHYFMAFLLLVHLLWFGGVIIWNHKTRPSPNPSQEEGDKTASIKAALLMFGGTLLLFLPWLPIVLARLGDDPSYWLGSLKLVEVAQDVLISFSVGGKREMIWEAHGLPLAFGFAGLLIICLIILLKNKAQRPSALFLLLWLILPVAATILLSYQTPKFNPRYTMLAWPPFALILAGGLSPKSAGRGRKMFLTLALLFIAGSWLFSLRNWYFDEDFRKDDFKALAQFVDERFTPGDTVLLSSGHLFPVWQYYAGSENWTPLPQMETLDVNRVTNFEILPTIQTALNGHGGVWLVSWQDEVIDPNGVVPLILDSVGERLNDEFHGGDFIGLGLQYWQLPPNPAFPADFPAQVRSDFNFGNLVNLRGLWQNPNNETEVVLFWQALQPLNEDYQLSLQIVDEAGLPWSSAPAVRRPADYLYPASRWPVNSVVAGRQSLPFLPGTPPGKYWLEIGWLNEAGEGIDVLDANGNPQRRTARLGPISLNQTTPAPPIENSTPIRLGGLALLTAQFKPLETEAGSRAIFSAYWKVDNPAGPPVTLFGWKDSAANSFPLPTPIAVRNDLPAGTIFLSQDKVSTPAQAQPGPVALIGQAKDETASLASLTLLPTERNFSAPDELNIQSEANFANKTRLLGADLSQTTAIPGERIPLTLYWESLTPFETDYTVFVHLLGADGRPVLIADHAPPRPTTNWLEGEIISDPVELNVPAELPPGRYALEVGLYNQADPAFARLSLADGSADYVILTEIEVETVEK